MMNESVAAGERGSSGKMFVLQLVLAMCIAITFGLVKGQWSAVSALYGSGCAMLMAFLLAQSIRIASSMTARQATTAVAALYVGAVIRFVLLIILLGAGLGLLTLVPLPMLLGFAIVQLMYPLLGKRR